MNVSPFSRVVEEGQWVRFLNTLPYSMVITENNRLGQIIRQTNDAFTNLTGFSAEEALGRNCRFLQGPATDPSAVLEIGEALRQGKSVTRDVLNYRKDGTTFWNRMAAWPVTDELGEIDCFIGTQLDVSEQYAAREQAVELGAQLKSMTSHLPGYYFRRSLGADGVTYEYELGENVWHLLGYSEPQDPAGLLEHVHPADRAELMQLLHDSTVEMRPYTTQVRMLRTDGAVLWFRVYGSPRRRPDGGVVFDGICLDVTQEVESSQRLTYLAFYDPLTGLRNRLLFTRFLADIVPRIDSLHAELRIFSIDIKEFQELNNTFGPGAGDLALRTVADRLRTFAGPDGAAARLSGDQFAALCIAQPGDIGLLEMAHQVHLLLTAPIVQESGEIQIDLYVAAASYPFSESDKETPTDVGDELLHRVNLALVETKRGGRGQIRVYSRDIDERVTHRTLIRRSMRQAIDRGEFRLVYHPMVELETGRVVGAEALVRWIHPELGMQRPDFFIPIAESSGLIVALGAWIFRTALAQARAWSLLTTPPLSLAVNISTVQLRDPGFLDMVEQALALTGADPRHIELELTESVFAEPTNAIIDCLKQLKRRGFRIAIDDFGTGYASFHYLRDFPVDIVKIDQGFVRHMVRESSDASIVRAILALCKDLRLSVVAEGIETLAQRDFLREAGCEVGQGYLFSMPITAEDFEWMVGSRMALPAVTQLKAQAS